jgi:hypothetical protein
MCEELTHRGWFLACPVYIGAPESPEPVLAPRRFIPEWWMTLNELVFGAFAIVATALAPGFDPMYPILITGLRHGGSQ